MTLTPDQEKQLASLNADLATKIAASDAADQTKAGTASALVTATQTDADAGAAQMTANQAENDALAALLTFLQGILGIPALKQAKK